MAQITKTTTNKNKKLAKDISHNLENSSSYAHVTNSQQLDNDLQERLRKLETNADSQIDQSRIQNDITQCVKETQNVKSSLIDLSNIVNTNKTEFEKNMLNLTQAITSTNKLAETFEKNTHMLEQNMVQIAKREVDVLRKEQDVIFSNQRTEYLGHFSNAEQRLLRIENMLKISPSAFQNVNQQNLNAPRIQSYQYQPQSQSQTPTVLHEMQCFRPNTPASQSMVYQAPWNDNASATMQQNNYRS